MFCAAPYLASNTWVQLIKFTRQQKVLSWLWSPVGWCNCLCWQHPCPPMGVYEVQRHGPHGCPAAALSQKWRALSIASNFPRHVASVHQHIDYFTALLQGFLGTKPQGWTFLSGKYKSTPNPLTGNGYPLNARCCAPHTGIVGWKEHWARTSKGDRNRSKEPHLPAERSTSNKIKF